MNESSIMIMVFFLVLFFMKTPKQLIKRRACDFLIFTLGVYGERVYSYFILLVNKYEWEIGNLSFLLSIFMMILFMQDKE